MYPLARTDRMILAALGVGLLCVGVVGGRWSKGEAPSRVTEAAKQTEATKEKTHEQVQGAATTQTQGSAAVVEHTTTRRFRSNGTLVSETVSGRDTKATTATQAQSVSIQWKDRDREVIREVEVVRTVEGPRPKWTMLAGAGVSWTGERFYSGGVLRRVAGPFVAGVEVNNYGGSLLVGVTF